MARNNYDLFLLWVPGSTHFLEVLEQKFFGDIIYVDTFFWI